MDTDYSNATVVGGGVIGISWAGLFLAHGLRVTITDPEPGIEPLVRAGLAEVAPTLSALGLPTEQSDGQDRRAALRARPCTRCGGCGRRAGERTGASRAEAAAVGPDRGRRPAATPCSPARARGYPQQRSLRACANPSAC